MTQRLFGTDGVRGRIGKPPMTPDVLVRLGFAAGQVLAGNTVAPQVLISKDTRLSGYMVESALEAGFAAAGVDVLLSGPLPTSAVSYLTQTLRLSAGVVISASHNPYDDNGVKFFAADGCKLPDETEAGIEQAAMTTQSLSFVGEPGRARRLDDAAGRYVEFCKRSFPSNMSLRGKRVLVDCANGAAYHVAPPVFHELGAEVIPFCDKPDGFNINVNCGVMEPAAAAQKTAACGANVGVILDGDADRVFLADETGTIHNGDALLYLIAQAEHQRGNTLQGVAGTIMSNLALEQALATMGTDFYRADVGDRRVLQALVKNDWPLGGETSGHIVLRWLHSTGDGIIAALQVLAIMCETGKPLSELLANFHPLPQCSRNVKVADKRKALENNVVQQALSEVETRLRGHGRIVVRPSGTEEFVRIMVEAENKTFAQAAADEIYAALTAV
ncbi:phosphoglucosamine mutase [Candidatus Persebacteraceae bacterium Df01]|jgi:phosphoglucosamine mutase|uniref:Phosphoglucosamine mutase n=1 Tax=Candidatus Doriopsillibacter californiensis TaxID=2970740 RepID=A0ABT7QMZ5_9GAMM|nr:phosphoglucosamine mutase [Candidatus Persebacteraceae bacterium Df01]